jgi:hypothetical protein
MRVRLQLVDIGDQCDDLEQVIQSHLLTGGHLDEGDVSTPVFGHDLHLGELLLDTIRVGRREIDLVDRHDQRHVRGPDVGHRLAGRGHHAVIRRHHQHSYVRSLRPAGAHSGEGLMAGGVQEGDLPTVDINLVRANVLRNAAGFPLRYVGGADGIEQLGLAVVDVAHDGDHRRPWLGVRVCLRLDAAGLEVLALATEGRFLFQRLPAQALGNASGGREIDLLIDGGHHAHLHQLLDDLNTCGFQHLGQFANGENTGQGYWLAHDWCC